MQFGNKRRFNINLACLCAGQHRETVLIMSQKQTPDSALSPSSSMVFTLEDDNHAAPVYETRIQEWETAPHDWQEDDNEYEENEMTQRIDNNIIDHVQSHSQSTENTEIENISSVSKENLSVLEKVELVSVANVVSKTEEYIEQSLLNASIDEEQNEVNVLTEIEHNVIQTENNATNGVVETTEKTEEFANNKEESVATQLEHSILEKALEVFKLPDTLNDSVEELPPVDDDHDFKMDAEEPSQNNDGFELDSLTHVKSEYNDLVQTDPINEMANTDEPVSRSHEEFRLDKENDAVQPTELAPDQIDYARDKYLHHVQHEHNNSVFDGGLDGEVSETVTADAGVILKEEWLAAQNELNHERKSDFQLPLQTIKVNVDEQMIDASQSVSEITIHVYDILDLPMGKKVKVLSEQELLNNIREKLRPHLANAVAGLAGRILQKKTAMLSYELQMMLNEEIPQVVEEVLDYNLENILQTVKVEAE